MNKAITDTKGSTLTWVMVVSLVLTLLIVAIMGIISYNAYTTSRSHTHTQAYYTAQSVNERITSWLSGSPSPGSKTVGYSDAYDFINAPDGLLYTRSVEETYSEEDLGAGMGTATTVVEFTSDKNDEIRVTTTAEYAGSVETLSVLMYIKQVSSFNSVNTGFDYSAPEISELFAEIEQLPTWEDQATWAKQYSSSTTYDPNAKWWTTFVDDYTQNIVDYRMDLLAVSPGDYRIQPSAVLGHDYSFKYLQNRNFGNTTKELVHIDLDPSRGSFFLNQGNEQDTNNIPPVEVGSANNPVIAYPFPYNNTDLRIGSGGVSTVKGVFLTIDPIAQTNVSNRIAHQKIVYYTKDHEGFDKENWPDLTLGAYVESGNVPPALAEYSSLNLYITDTSEKTFEINSGLALLEGSLYTKRSTSIGTVFDETGPGANGMNAYTKGTDLYFFSYNFIFADPGVGESTRYSRISGTENNGGSAQTRIEGGNIVVQSNHELTIGSGTSIDLTNNKGIVVEPGGSLIIEGGTDITSNIYIANGGTLTIVGPTTITGNIYCSGTLNVESSFSIYPLDTSPDNQELGYITTNNVRGNCTGIFIYNDANVGVGTLRVASNCIISSPVASPYNSNLVHSFVPYPEYNPALFCNHANEESHVCEAWTSNDYVWVTQPGTTEEVR